MERAVLLINRANGVDSAHGGRSTYGEEKFVPYLIMITN